MSRGSPRAGTARGEALTTGTVTNKLAVLDNHQAVFADPLPLERYSAARLLGRGRRAADDDEAFADFAWHGQKPAGV